MKKKSSLATRNSSLATRHSFSGGAMRKKIITRHSPLVTRNSSLATHFMAVPWKINYHSSLATRHSPFVTHLFVTGGYQFLSWVEKRHFRWRHFGLDILRARQIFRDIFVERQNLRGQEKRDIFVANRMYCVYESIQGIQVESRLPVVVGGITLWQDCWWSDDIFCQYIDGLSIAL